MALNAYLKDWESHSAISKTQSDIICDIQRLIDFDLCISQSKNVKPEKEIKQQSEQLNDKLYKHQNELGNLLELMNECKENIYELKKNHSKLMEKTDEFQSKCGSILKDQKTLGDISEELTKSLDYYKEIDGISKNVYKKNAEILTPESNFPRTLIVLEDAEIFFSQNADYLDSKEYLAKISTVKMRISEIIQTYIQQVVTENYIQNLTNDPLTPETLETYKNYLYSSLEELDSVSNSLIVFQKFATEKSILG